jgi:hypothetical protein
LTCCDFNVHVTFTFEPPSSAEANAPDLVGPRLAMLQELTEMGMDMARTVHRRATAEPAADAEPNTIDLALMFSRLARTVRQTLALQARFEQDQLEAGREARAKLCVGRKMTVRRIVERAIDADTGVSDSDTDNLLTDLYERLADQDDADFTDRPVADLVARICRDLGVKMDRALWQDEAAEPFEIPARFPSTGPVAGAGAGAGAESCEHATPP